MGTQQILLIVLSVIIVGVAVSVGIQMFNTQKDSSEIQAIASDLQNYGAQVIAYLQTPTSLGGGNGAVASTDRANICGWLGFNKTTFLTTNNNATYTVTVSGTDIVITADNDATSNITIGQAATTLSDATVAL